MKVTEVEYRMPTLKLIRDDELRQMTAELTTKAPWHFWKFPATRSSNYHHPVCRKDRGLWAHTLMLSTYIERMRDSLELRGFSEYDVDMAHSAAILHDQLKNGTNNDYQARGALDDHDVMMAERADDFGMPSEVGDAIETHMGPDEWYEGRAPETELEKLVHQADMHASSPHITSIVQKPVPMELLDIGLRGADLK